MMHPEKDAESAQSSAEADTPLIDLRPDGGLEAWMVVAGAWSSSFCSWGWINSQFLSPGQNLRLTIKKAWESSKNITKRISSKSTRLARSLGFYVWKLSF
jgi:hypothetical protein